MSWNRRPSTAAEAAEGDGDGGDDCDGDNDDSGGENPSVVLSRADIKLLELLENIGARAGASTDTQAKLLAFLQEDFCTVEGLTLTTPHAIAALKERMTEASPYVYQHAYEDGDPPHLKDDPAFETCVFPLKV